MQPGFGCQNLERGSATVGHEGIQQVAQSVDYLYR
jgi:hypothetical protein